MIQRVSALTTALATKLRRVANISLRDPIIIVEKRHSLQDDPNRGTRKRPRRVGSPAKGVFRTLTRYTIQGTYVTSPIVVYALGDDAY